MVKESQGKNQQVESSQRGIFHWVYGMMFICTCLWEVGIFKWIQVVWLVIGHIITPCELKTFNMSAGYNWILLPEWKRKETGCHVAVWSVRIWMTSSETFMRNQISVEYHVCRGGRSALEIQMELQFIIFWRYWDIVNPFLLKPTVFLNTSPFYKEIFKNKSVDILIKDRQCYFIGKNLLFY